MFDLLTLPCAQAPLAAPLAPAAALAPVTPWLALMLDEIDYGMLLLAEGASVLHANHAARRELDASHPLQLIGGELRVTRSADLLPLREALAGARERGLRRLISLGEGGQRVSVAVVPLAAAALSGATREDAAHWTFELYASAFWWMPSLRALCAAKKKAPRQRGLGQRGRRR